MAETLGQIQVVFGADQPLAVGQRQAIQKATSQVVSSFVARLQAITAGAAGGLVGRVAGPGAGAVAGGAAGGLLRAAGTPAGLTAGVLVIGLGAFAFALHKATDAVRGFMAEVPRLARFDPSVAGAFVQQQVRGLFRDIRRAQFLGPDLARMTVAVETFKDRFATIVNAIDKVVVGLVTPMIEAVNQISLEGVGSFLRGAGIGAVAGGQPLLGALLQAIAGETKRSADQLEKMSREELAARANAVIMRDLEHLTEGATVHYRGYRGTLRRPIVGPPAPGEDAGPHLFP